MISFNESTVSKSRMISRRMFLLTAAKAIVLVGIFGRLVSLQINESTKDRTLSDKNRFREWRLAPKRGIIKDYFGKEIASNEKVYQLHITPENTSNISELLFRLKNVKKRPLLDQGKLELSINKIYSERKKIYNESHFRIKCNSMDKDEIVYKIIKLYESSRNKI